MTISSKRATPPSRGRGATRPVVLSHGFDGRFEPSVATVDDPYEEGAKREVVVNLRHDVLTHWRARRMIDDAEFAAGRWFQKLWEQAEIGTLGAMRYDKPMVDGGKIGDPLNDQVLEAHGALSRVAAVLGIIDYPLMCRVVGQGHTIEVEARTYWNDNRLYVGARIRDALKVLANECGTGGTLEAGKMRAKR